MPAVADSPWLEALNPEQRAAATHTGGPLLILAGAGTGKTTTLCARVAWLVGRGRAVGADPAADVHAPRGARDAAARARRWCTPATPARARRHVPLGGAPDRPPARRRARAARPASACSTPATRRTCSTCVREEHGHAAAKAALPAQVDAAGHLLAHGQRAAAAVRGARRALPVVRGAPGRALGAVQGLHGAQAGARGDRPRRPAAVLARAGPRRGHRRRGLAAAFDHVLVDEYQDVNGLQVEIVRALGEHGPAVTAVGDDFQAIYGFRSASAGHILDFPAHFPGHAWSRWSATTARRSRCSTRRTRLPAQAARGVPEAAAGRAGGRRAAARAVTAATRPRRPSEVVDARARRPARRASSCARRPC